MKYLITGMHGTVAPAVANVVKNRGDEVVSYDRTSHDVNSSSEVESYLSLIKPDIIIHSAHGSADWARRLAHYAEVNGAKFAYISTVDVYGEHNPGPYTVVTEPRPETQYANYKLDVERALAFTSQSVYIMRLGWQIGSKASGNNMLDFLDKLNRENGSVDADDTWYPSCAYLQDCAEAIVNTITNHRPDLYLFNANMNKNFYTIVCKLAALHPECNLKINRVSGMNRDNIMIDKRIALPEI